MSSTRLVARVRRMLPARHARKRLGQHFLVRGWVRERILGAAELAPGDTVVEVGPGLGELTGGLAERAGRVVAVELDEELAFALGRECHDLGNVTVVHADARAVDLVPLVGEAPFKVVANLPYYAALPILRRFLDGWHRPSMLVVMVQREVARAMLGAPGGVSLLTLAVQFYGVPRLVCTVPPSAFAPRPKVASAVVRIDVRDSPAVEAPDGESFFRVARAGFAAPRKQMRNSLAAGLGVPGGVASRLLAWAEIEGSLRPAEVPMDGWARLAWAYRRLDGALDHD